MEAIQEIRIEDLSKRFRGSWLFQSLNFTFQPGDRMAILGPNGSGKSTLLKIISGYMAPSKGKVVWATNEIVEPNYWHRHYTYGAPYQELVEEYSLTECLDFHFSLKACREDVDLDDWLEKTSLNGHKDKKVSRFSSGMKQRLKLVLTMASKSQIFFLDEPCSNLDEDGIKWYQREVANLPAKSIVFIASNSKKEYEICDRFIHIR